MEESEIVTVKTLKNNRTFMESAVRFEVFFDVSIAPSSTLVFGRGRL